MSNERSFAELRTKGFPHDVNKGKNWTFLGLFCIICLYIGYIDLDDLLNIGYRQKRERVLRLFCEASRYPNQISRKTFKRKRER